MADARQQRTAAVRDVGVGAGALVVGVAAASAFNEFVPEGHRPEDVLRGLELALDQDDPEARKIRRGPVDL